MSLVFACNHALDWELGGLYFLALKFIAVSMHMSTTAFRTCHNKEPDSGSRATIAWREIRPPSPPGCWAPA